MRLFDLIASKRMALNPYAMQEKTPEQALETMRRMRDDVMSAVPIDITNVAEYLFSSNDQEVWDWGKDFPNLAPPFDQFWMEYKAPNVFRSKELGERYYQDVPTYGFYFRADPDDDGWRLEGALFALGNDPSVKGPYVVGPNLVWVSHIKPDGSLSGGRPFIGLPYPPPDGLEEKIYNHELDGAGSIFFPVGLALSLLHCKNVAIEDAPDIRTRQQRRYDERKGTKPIEFKTLVIDPMKHVLKTEGGAERHGLRRALHACRGHFKTYTAEKPRFGRDVGMFYVRPHLRGSADVGMVGKDYKVKAPKQEAR